MLLQKELNSYISSKPKYPNVPSPLLCKSSPLSLVPVRTLALTCLRAVAYLFLKPDVTDSWSFLLSPAVLSLIYSSVCVHVQTPACSFVENQPHYSGRRCSAHSLFFLERNLCLCCSPDVPRPSDHQRGRSQRARHHRRLVQAWEEAVQGLHLHCCALQVFG